MTKIGATEKENHEKCDTKELTGVKSEPTYIDIQVCTEEIGGNLTDIIPIEGQGNRLIGDYM